MQGMLIVDADGHLRDLVDNCYRPYLEPPFNDRQIFWPSDGFDRNKNGRLGVRDVDAPKQLRDMDCACSPL